MSWFSSVKSDVKKLSKHWPSADCYGADDDGDAWIAVDGSVGKCRACGRKIKVKEPMFAGKCGMEWSDERREREERARLGG